MRPDRNLFIGLWLGLGMVLIVALIASSIYSFHQTYLNYIHHMRDEFNPTFIILTVSAAMFLFAWMFARTSRLAKGLSESEYRFKQLLDHMSSGVVVCRASPNGQEFVICDFNLAAERIEELNRRDILGQSLSKAFANLTELGLLDAFNRVHQTGKAEHFPITLYQDEHITGWRNNYLYKLPNNEVVLIYDDVTRIKQSEERVDHLVHHDTLTDLPNRLLLTDRLQQAITQSKRERTYTTLMALNLDQFRPVNDVFGYDIGDQLLREVAGRLQYCIRKSDTAARVGGDEFFILLPLIEEEHDATIVAEKIRLALSEPFNLDGNDIYVSASIGIAVFPRDGDTCKRLIKNADIAMYHAKRSGGNTAEYYLPGMA